MNAVAPRPAVVLHFELDGEALGIDVAHVGEIIAATPLVRLPGTPAAIAGLTALRARPLTVIDLAALLALAPAATDSAAAFMVLAEPWDHVALRVPAAIELGTVASDRDPAESFAPRTDRVGDVRLLDPEALVAAAELALAGPPGVETTPWT